MSVCPPPYVRESVCPSSPLREELSPVRRPMRRAFARSSFHPKSLRPFVINAKSLRPFAARASRAFALSRLSTDRSTETARPAVPSINLPVGSISESVCPRPRSQLPAIRPHRIESTIASRIYVPGDKGTTTHPSLLIPTLPASIDNRPSARPVAPSPERSNENSVMRNTSFHAFYAWQCCRAMVLPCGERVETIP